MTDGRDVRLGAISFVNTVPIYADFKPGLSLAKGEQPVELVYDVPARLNAMMLAGGLDVSPVSSACYLRNRERFVLLDDLSVSSYGAVESVLFLSRAPFGPALLSELPVLSVPDDSETSIALLQHLINTDDSLPLKTYHAPAWREALAETGNALVIGDNALTLRYAGIPEGFHCTDLSSLWQARTGLPFVFAVWVAERAWAESHPQALATLNAELCASRDRFFRDPAVFDQGLSLAQARSVLSAETLSHYYRDCLDYRLSDDHHAALTRFGQILAASLPEVHLEAASPAGIVLPKTTASGITRS